jgi:hypothetical protein
MAGHVPAQRRSRVEGSEVERQSGEAPSMFPYRDLMLYTVSRRVLCTICTSERTQTWNLPCMSTCFNSRTAGRIMITFYMNIVLLEATRNSCFFFISYIMADAKTRSVEAKLATLIWSSNNRCKQIFEK